MVNTLTSAKPITNWDLKRHVRFQQHITLIKRKVLQNLTDLPTFKLDMTREMSIQNHMRKFNMPSHFSVWLLLSAVQKCHFNEPANTFPAFENAESSLPAKNWERMFRSRF